MDAYVNDLTSGRAAEGAEAVILGSSAGWYKPELSEGRKELCFYCALEVVYFIII